MNGILIEGILLAHQPKTGEKIIWPIGFAVFESSERMLAEMLTSSFTPTCDYQTHERFTNTRLQLRIWIIEWKIVKRISNPATHLV